MRTYLMPFLPVALALATPALAQAPDPVLTGDETAMIEQLNDPEFQADMATSFSTLMRAFMDMPIGPIVSAVEQALPEGMAGDRPMSNIAPDATLGDLARGDNPDFEEDMEDKLRTGTAMMGLMASELGTLLPQLRAMGDRLTQRMNEIE